jgi:medium-chain acyl-[acyl-carrier-protein] hydrolase
MQLHPAMGQEVRGDRWLIRPKPRSSVRMRLWCFPYAGVGASAFRTWPESLPDEVEVCLVQLPGRESRLKEAPFKELPTLVRAAATALSPALDVPFVFFGHSLGALVAFELARDLRRNLGVVPRHLIVSGRRAPQLPERFPPLGHLPDRDFVAEICRRYDGIPQPVLQNTELLSLLLPGLRADFALNENYMYRSEDPFPCPFSALGGSEDPTVNPDELAAWREHTTGPFRQHLFPGNHFFLQSARKELLRWMSELLDRMLWERTAAAR